MHTLQKRDLQSLARFCKRAVFAAQRLPSRAHAGRIELYCTRFLRNVSTVNLQRHDWVLEYQVYTVSLGLIIQHNGQQSARFLPVPKRLHQIQRCSSRLLRRHRRVRRGRVRVQHYLH